MTNEQILKLAETCGFDRHISKTTNDIYWECDEDDLLKFAALIYTEGFKVGYDEGWDSSKVSTEMNPMEGIYE